MFSSPSISRYSLISTVLLVGLSVLPIAIWGMDFDYATAEVIGYITMFLSLSLIFFAIKRMRDHELGGKISFGKAFGSGMLIALVAAIGFAIYTWILVGYWHPEFTEDYYAYVMENASQKMEPEEFQVYAAKVEKQKEAFSHPWFQSLVMGITILMIGFVISLISSTILKTGNKSVEGAGS